MTTKQMDEVEEAAELEQKAREALTRGGPMKVLPPEPAPMFTPGQETRAEALRVARDVVSKRGSVLTGSSVEVGVPELVDLAEYIVAGTHPLDRYETPTPSEDA